MTDSGSQLDLVLAGGNVADGTGAPAIRADVGVAGGRIAAIGALADVRARRRLDVRGLLVAPGFVDAHIHSERVLLDGPHAPSTRQGVTTHVVGQDGFGFAPADARTLAFYDRYLRGVYPPWTAGAHDVGSFLDLYDGASTVNVATLVPNGLLRTRAIGDERRPATAEELAAMLAACADALDAGAVGLSSGLDYVTSGYADTDELVALAQVAASRGGVYVTHMRYELGMEGALAEAIEIGRRAGVRVHISHLIAEVDDPDAAAAWLAQLAAARAAGVDVTFDCYPYTYGCTTLAYVLPHELCSGTIDALLHALADPAVRERLREHVPRAHPWLADARIAGALAAPDAHLTGLSFAEAAGRAGVELGELACDLLARHELAVMLLTGDPADARGRAAHGDLLRHPLQLVGSDGVFGDGLVHPRGCAAFARFLRWTVDERLLTVEEAIRRMSSAPALRHGLLDRGLLRPGMAADVAVLDVDRYGDAPAPATGAELAEGVAHVVVGGELALLDGRMTGAAPGRGLRRHGTRTEEVGDGA